jgi:hypothetical protein
MNNEGGMVGEGRNLTALPVSPLVEITPLRGSMRGRGVFLFNVKENSLSKGTSYTVKCGCFIIIYST